MKRWIALLLSILLLLTALSSCAKQGEQGIQGEKGEQGEQGVQGIQGEKGEKGDQGEQGIQGIQGEKGDKGDQGEQGIQGIQGEKGDKGDQGIQGIQGEKGDQGEQGIQGIQGEKGDKGDQGIQGIQGEKGDQGEQGIQGIQGEKGDKGDQGIQGIQGIQGETGKSAFELYCEAYGYEGTEEQWIADLISGHLTTYTVSFDLNGGVGGADYQASVTVPAGTLVPLCEPTREGYTFVGWYTGEGVNDGAVSSTTPIKQDLNLIARWQINKLTVKFLGKDGQILKYQTVDYGTAASAPTAPTIDRLKFTGWDTDFSVVTSNLTVRSIYVSNVYTLTYNTDGGTELEAEEYYVGDIPVRPRTDPTKSGFYFIGWYLDDAFTSEYAYDTALTADTTLYAKFSESIAIRDAAGLIAIKNSPSSKYYLANDIDLEGATWTPISYFNGVLDGEGHKIHNFVISTTLSTAGFFAQNSGTIKNVTLEDFSFAISTSGTVFHAGPLVGNNSSTGVIDNCHIKDTILSFSYYKSGTGSSNSVAGGLVGTNSGKILNSTVSANIIGEVESYLQHESLYGQESYYGIICGGIVGTNNSTIQNTMADVTLTFSLVANANSSSAHAYSFAILFAGGAVGNNKGNMLDCGANLELVVTPSLIANGRYAHPRCSVNLGGFAYSNDGTISSCLSKGSIIMESDDFHATSISGFIDENHSNGKINNCYADVNITSKSIGESLEPQISGFVGENAGSVISCYAMGDIDTCMQGAIGGFVGKNVKGASISKSFCVGNITCTNKNQLGYFVGVAEGGSTLFKCYYNNAMSVKVNGVVSTPTNTDGTTVTTVQLQGRALLIDTLSWSEDVWTLQAGGYPTLAWETTEE